MAECRVEATGRLRYHATAPRPELPRRDLPPGVGSGSKGPPTGQPTSIARGHSGMDRTPQRRDRVRRTFKADRVDGLLVVSGSNVSYLTGFTGDSSALLLTRDRALVISDGRYATQLAQE